MQRLHFRQSPEGQTFVVHSPDSCSRLTACILNTCGLTTVLVNCPSASSHTRAVWSDELVTIFLPSALKVMCTISAVWPCEGEGVYN